MLCWWVLRQFAEKRGASKSEKAQLCRGSAGGCEKDMLLWPPLPHFTLPVLGFSMLQGSSAPLKVSSQFLFFSSQWCLLCISVSISPLTLTSCSPLPWDRFCETWRSLIPVQNGNKPLCQSPASAVIKH